VDKHAPTSYAVEPLASDHDRTAFSCGKESLDRYIKQQASQDVKRHLATAYVLCASPSRVVIGYYTLSALSVEPGDLPADMARRLPRYPLLPAILIGRLARDRGYPGQRLGERLLKDALTRSLVSGIGAIAVLVDAIDDEARGFYEAYGLRSIPATKRLLLPMATVEGLVRGT